MAERRRKYSLHAFVSTKALHSKPKVFFTSSPNSREDLLVKTLPAPFHYAAASRFSRLWRGQLRCPWSCSLTRVRMVFLFYSALLKRRQVPHGSRHLTVLVSNPSLSAIFILKMANEDVSLHFTVPSGTTSLKKRSFFFTSSPSPREDLLVKSLPMVACEDIRFAHLWSCRLVAGGCVSSKRTCCA